MQILITGAAGFVGQAFTKQLLSDTTNTYNITLTDIIEPPVPSNNGETEQVRTVKADLCTDSASVVTPDLNVIYIFHGIMSSGAEADFDLGFKVNFDGTRTLLETIRKTCPGAKVIYASTHAVYGRPFIEPLDENTLPTPESSYGCQKLMCEALVNEYTRRGFVDGLVMRFPTVTVRPGKPTQAASSFYSGIIREPLKGEECVVPMKEREFRHWVCSPRILVENLQKCLWLDFGKLEKHIRVVNHPGISVSIQDMMDSLGRVAGEDKLRHVKEKEDEKVKAIVKSWPAAYDNKRALELGFSRDASFDDIVREYMEELSRS